MLLILAAAVAVVLWAWREQGAKAIRFGDVAAVVAVIAGVSLFEKGALYGFVPLALAGWWFWQRPRAAAGEMPLARARALLRVSPADGAEAIRAAHRRLIAEAHPDAGGTAAAAQRINRARDVLLADLAARAPRPS